VGRTPGLPAVADALCAEPVCQLLRGDDDRQNVEIE
jgi:hypothetical protein